MSKGGGCLTVGVAGLIQSGGFGSFSKRYGTAAATKVAGEVGRLERPVNHRDCKDDCVNQDNRTECDVPHAMFPLSFISLAPRCSRPVIQYLRALFIGIYPT